MKGLLKLLSMFLVLMIVMSVFIGCNSGGKETETTTTTKVVETDEETTEKQTTEKQFEGPSWKQNEDFVADWYLSMSWYGFSEAYDTENVLVAKKIYEETGLKDINFILAEGSQDEKLNAMIAAKNIPDIITLENRSSIERLIEAGAVHDLLELGEQYAPEFNEQMADMQSVVNWYSTEDGHFYYFPQGTTALEWRGSPKVIRQTQKRGTNVTLLANEYFMSELGVKPEDFGTQDGMFEALMKCKNSGLKYDDKDLIPLIIQPGDGKNDHIEGYAQFFGLEYEDAEGNYIPPWTNPRYFEVIQFFNRLFRAGLIDEENIIWRTKYIHEYIRQGIVFAGMGAIGGAQVYFKNLYTDSDYKMKFIPVEPVRAKDGAEPLFKQGFLGSWLNTFISKNTEKAPEIIRTFAYLHSEEGQMYCMFGEEGITYNKTDHPLILEWTDEVDEAKKDDALGAAWKYGFKDVLYMLQDNPTRWSHWPNPETDEDIMAEQFSDLASKYTYSDDAIINVFGAPKAETDEAEIYANIVLLMDEEIPKMFLAETDEELMNLYNSAVEKIKGYGLDKLTAYRDEIFQRDKAKLGTDFITPKYMK